MRGIILSGGNGTRLYPSTKATNKQLLPVYNKPLIYYPLATFMEIGIREVLIISTPSALSSYKKLFENGNQIGINVQYAIQKKPDGIAQAIVIAKKFLKNENFSLILGDNFFYGFDFTNWRSKNNLAKGAHIFGKQVSKLNQYGVIKLTSEGKILNITEKPKKIDTGFAIPGLYFFDNQAIDLVKSIKKSKRGEYEITELLNRYLSLNQINLTLMNDTSVWFDCGTPDSLLEASNYVQAVQKRNRIEIAALELIAYKNGWITKSEITRNLESSGQNEYLLFIESSISQINE
jgi:glucose-1-phosphate thymidylyltransferase